ncbi:MAG: hypothetical protein HC938_17175, partial [Nitrospira sp.]|nr:hypothetical protein [Nitrospira sp.]
MSASRHRQRIHRTALREQARCINDADGTTATDSRIVFLQVEGNLFFAAADDLEDRFNALEAQGVDVVILRLKRTHMVGRDHHA